MPDREEKLVSLTGVLVASAWSPKSKVRAVCLETVDEEEYLIAEGSPDLRRHLRRGVTVTGIVLRDSQGRLAIRVTDYQILPQRRA